MTTLKIGDSAPTFALEDQSGALVSSSDFKGKRLLVYFYPRAMTPGCTTQSIAVGQALPALKKQRIAAVGISPDTPDRQAKFDEKYGLGFPLLSDPDMKVADSFGAYGEKKSFGETKLGIIRSSFLIDENGKILEAWYGVKPDDTVPNALACAAKK